MPNTTVIKRDGQKEPYDPEKIIKVVMAAGLDQEKSRLLAQEITDWLTQNKPQEIASIQLRDMIAGKLHKYDESVAKMFIWYQSTK